MFKSNSLSSDQFDFNFSDFRAIKVPKGWDKLFISLVSIETGKTISKLGKASVRNETCRWKEPLSESVFIPKDDSNSNDLECCLFKFVVAMGSSRSGILGEAEFNIGNYTDYDSPTPLSLPLKKCNYSTSLKFKVQCLTPKTSHRDVQNKETALHVDYGSSDQDDMAHKSDASDGVPPRSVVTNSSDQQAVFGRDTSLSASGSCRSFDSADVSSRQETFPQNSPGATHLNGTLDSSNDNSRSNNSYLNSSDPDSTNPNGNRNVPNSSNYEAMQQEMEKEIEFLKESNADLTKQLQKTQESNVELLTILQELEGIVESQKQEIEGLKASEKHGPIEDADKIVKTTETEDIGNIKLQLEQMQETQEELEGAIKFLEKSVEEKDNEIKTLKTKSSVAVIGSSCGSPNEHTCKCGEEMIVLRGQLEELQEELRNQEVLIEEAAASAESQVQCQELDGKCTELEHQLQSSEHRIGELEDEVEDLTEQLSTLENLRDENWRLEEKVEKLEQEKIASADCTVEELREGIVTLQSSVDSHISENKVLERLKSELGKGKDDLERQLSELEKENVELSDKVSSLEAQLRHVTNEKEACNTELRNSESQVADLRDGIRRIEIESEAHKNDMRQKLQDMRDKWFEAQEECEYLKQANPKLQATAENLITECSSLQKLNEELKRHNIHLHTRCSIQESQLRELQKNVSECLSKIEGLEVEISELAADISLKERSLKSELDSLVIESREHQQKLVEENLSLNNMYSQKVIEVEKLQKELVHFIEQMSGANDKQESGSSDALFEVSTLRADKAKLEASLHEMQTNFTYLESKLSKLEIEYEEKLQELVDSKQNYEFLEDEYDRALSVVERYKNNEENLKSNINEVEMKLKASDYEKLQLGKEISSLKEQLQGEALHQDEVLTLKTSLNEAKFECAKTKASLDMVSADVNELKTERDHLVQKVSNMDQALSDLEACQRSKTALEEKVLQLEGDLASREALRAQESELKIELSRVKRTNVELLRKVKHFEQGQKATTVSQQQSPRADNTDYLLKIQALEYELAEALDANEMYKAQLRRYCDRSGSSISAFEAELNDLKEKYFQITLKYAEVEAQREELVLKLKTKNKRSWFS